MTRGKHVRFSQFSKPAMAGAFTLTLIGGAVVASPAAAADGDVTPKNVIIMIGDGMGYNQVDLMNAEDSGNVHWQVDRGGDNKVKPAGHNTDPAEGWQSWSHLGMSTHWVDGPVYDPAESWTDFEWNKESPTDSAAAGTAMASGEKTYNGGLGVDADGNVLENLSERAHALGKSAGVVSSVPYSHATPAAFSAHNESRNNYHDIAHQQVTGDLEVVMGAGHPLYSDDNELLAEGDFSYISEEDWNALADGETDRTLVETNEDFEALTAGDTPESIFGVAQVASTLQQGRSDSAALNDVVDLPTMTAGALNVLDNNDEGFSLMVEGGAIDWTGHANDSERTIEEMRDFDAAVDTVLDWVETNSSWDDTLVVVTADHETGYLYGELEDDFSAIIPGAAEQTAPVTNDQATADSAGEPAQANVQGSNEPAVQKPNGDVEETTSDETAPAPIADTMSPAYAPVESVDAAHSWNSGNHTNQLVPFFYKGAGAETVTGLATDLDPIRGEYFDNITLPAWLLEEAWVAADEDQNDEDQTDGGDQTDGSQTDGDTDQTDGTDQDGDTGTDQDGSGTTGDDQDQNDGSSGDATTDESSADALAVTGADSPILPVGIALGALLIGGGALVAARLRRNATSE